MSLKRSYKKLALYSSLVSIVGSIGIFSLYDNDLGIFVGLWASTLLLLGNSLDEM